MSSASFPSQLLQGLVLPPAARGLNTGDLNVIVCSQVCPVQYTFLLSGPLHSIPLMQVQSVTGCTVHVMSSRLLHAVATLHMYSCCNTKSLYYKISFII